MHLLGLIIAVVAGAEPKTSSEVLERLRHSLSKLQAPVSPPLAVPLLTAPPLVEAANAPAQPEATDEEVLAPVAPRRALTPAASVSWSEPVTPAAPASRFGIIALAGGEAAVHANGGAVTLGLRVGMGVRFALLERSDDPTRVNATPSVGLVAGYSGAGGHSIFTELRTELLASQGGGLFLPGFTVYALGGLDTALNGDGVDPYVGMGIGWDHNIFKKSDSQPATSQGWGGGSWAEVGAMAPSSSSLARSRSRR